VIADVVYAVHTRTCSYLLDEDGNCVWIISPTGMLPADVRQCVGAQFVACVDTEAPGGLVGELRVGAAARVVRDDDRRMTLDAAADRRDRARRDPRRPVDGRAAADARARSVVAGRASSAAAPRGRRRGDGDADLSALPADAAQDAASAAPDEEARQALALGRGMDQRAAPMVY
jgi:hypothetical protein